jgi:hypothetical protein
MMDEQSLPIDERSPKPKKVFRQKLATAECFFPELKGKCIYTTGHGRGSSPRIAIARAMENALRPISGKQWHTVKATITVITEAPKGEPGKEANEAQA